MKAPPTSRRGAAPAAHDRVALRTNTVYNLLGQGLPVLVALVTIPFVTRGLGADRFGILALAWTFIGYFTLFDLGLGRSLTQMVAERLGDGREGEVSGLVWTGVALTAILGVAGAACVLLVSHPLVTGVLKIPEELREESLRALQLLGLSLPLVLSMNALKGLLEAYHRFDLVNLVRAPGLAFSFLGPLLVLPFSERLDIIVLVLVCSRAVSWLAYAFLSQRVHRGLLHPTKPERSSVRELLRMGGWISVSNIISPVLQFADRFLIGSLVSMSAVAYYATPSEVVTRVLAIPIAVASVFFPAFAATHRSDPAHTAEMFGRSVRATIALMLPVLIVLFVFSHPLLRLWVGQDFADNGAAVVRWLALGVLFNGLAQVPFALIHGTGRPQISAVFHLVEVPLYLALLWWALQTHGPAGAAFAWSARAGLDAGLLFAASVWILPGTRRGSLMAAAWGAASVIGFLGAWVLQPQVGAVTTLLLLLGLFAVAGWRWLLAD